MVTHLEDEKPHSLKYIKPLYSTQHTITLNSNITLNITYIKTVIIKYVVILMTTTELN